MDIIEWAKSQTKGGSFLAFPNCTSLPENDLYFAGTLFVNAKDDTWSISAICVTTGITYTNASSSAGSVWTGWLPLATAMKPQEFDLPLASGFSNGGGGNSVYWKDQFNQVHFLVSVTNQNSLSSGDVIATLPAGFRPSKTAIFVLGSLLSAVRKTGSLNVKSDGSIVYFGDPLSSGAVSFGAGAFVAAD